MDWDSFYAALLFPGPMMTGLSKADIHSLTWPQLEALLKRFREVSSNEASTEKPIKYTNASYNSWKQEWERERLKFLDKQNE